MGTQLPYWIQVLQALAVPAIALLGLGIAFGQWYTAHTRLVIDLFERRMAVYDALRIVMQKIGRDANADFDTVREYNRAVDPARFLFGKEVIEYLDDIHKTIIRMNVSHQVLNSPNSSPHQRGEHLDMQKERMHKVDNFLEDFTKLITPYVRMNHKLPRYIPAEWFRKSSPLLLL